MLFSSQHLSFLFKLLRLFTSKNELLVYTFGAGPDAYKCFPSLFYSKKGFEGKYMENH